MADIALILGAYLLGSAPHLPALAGLRHVSLDGDYHSSLWHKAGIPTGLIGILGEFAKGIIPVITGRLFDFDLAITAVAGLAAVCGQMWPVFARFDGEKGNTIGLAMATALATTAMIIAIIPVAVAVAIRTLPRILNRGNSHKRRSIFGGPPSLGMPLGMISAFLVLPLASWYLGKPLEVILGCLGLLIIILLRRLTAGVRRDFKTGAHMKNILKNRLLYDRAVSVIRGNEGSAKRAN